MIHSNVLRGVRIEKFGTIVISSSCAKKSTCIIEESDISHSAPAVNKREKERAQFHTHTSRGVNTSLFCPDNVFISLSDPYIHVSVLNRAVLECFRSWFQKLIALHFSIHLSKQYTDVQIQSCKNQIMHVDVKKEHVDALAKFKRSPVNRY